MNYDPERDLYDAAGADTEYADPYERSWDTLGTFNEPQDYDEREPPDVDDEDYAWWLPTTGAQHG